MVFFYELFWGGVRKALKICRFYCTVYDFRSMWIVSYYAKTLKRLKHTEDEEELLNKLWRLDEAHSFKKKKKKSGFILKGRYQLFPV